MILLVIKIILLIFSLLTCICLGFGFYSHDMFIEAIGILLILCIILLGLEYKKMLSNPFG
jgi:hypothetical protein